MSYSEKINADLKKAMLERNKIRMETLRAVKTAFILFRSEKGADYILTEAEEVRILHKLLKQRKESAQIYKEQNRAELFENEIKEAEVIESYLPAMIDDADLEKYLADLINKTGAKDIKDLGKIMSIAQKELSGKADGKTISDLAKKLLTLGT